MADSLDDFFAKKDKKRGKDKGKTVFSAESLVKELEEGSKQYEYPVRKDNKTSAAFELLGLDADDADWRDFEDIEKRDYTGLKVKEMSLQDQNEEEQRRLSEQSDHNAPEITPWSTSNNNNNKAPEPTESDAKPAEKLDKTNQEEPAEEKKSDKKSAKQAYVPPPERGLASGEVKILEPTKLTKSKTSSSRGNAATFDLKDEHLFPSLG